MEKSDSPQIDCWANICFNHCSLTCGVNNHPWFSYTTDIGSGRLINLRQCWTITQTNRWLITVAWMAIGRRACIRAHLCTSHVGVYVRHCLSSVWLHWEDFFCLFFALFGQKVVCSVKSHLQKLVSFSHNQVSLLSRQFCEKVNAAQEWLALLSVFPEKATNTKPSLIKMRRQIWTGILSATWSEV